jgi:phosphatidylserine/phosphatidylglycerophosphate/cardiolipin synthase-like enzyme
MRWGWLAAVPAALTATLVQTSAATTPFIEPDDGRAPVLEAFRQATTSIDVYLFRLSDEPLQVALADAAAKGVAVRALLEPCPGESDCTEPTPQAVAACDTLVAGGIAAKWGNPAFRKTHAKSILIDGRRALVISLNLISESFVDRRDYGVVTDDAAAVRDLALVFTQDWQDDPTTCQRPPSDRPADGASQDYGGLIVSPDNGRARILELLGSARSSLKIHMQKIDPNDRDILPAIIERIESGVDVQVLLSPPDREPDNGPAAEAIERAGGRAVFQTALRTHAKMMVIDGRAAYVGSHNLTRSSLDRRREIGWLTTDAATVRRFDTTFDADWTAESAPRRAVP